MNTRTSERIDTTKLDLSTWAKLYDFGDKGPVVTGTTVVLAGAILAAVASRLFRDRAVSTV